ncbi:uncharacterized protein GIQ15_04688 [Arthroderma uncinatum]|uniref:uncharacterized protein n=1 Tax=Arthroderma uncinatum TaxID=74035 RepID=UPI00144ABBAA|nr:uncharacterized protein GIQ15_04688 [Arthroderma uncinatum]KAF3481929.1 hypothetical protein GIQ15_04688 [Arthroderma uncinatum]
MGLYNHPLDVSVVLPLETTTRSVLTLQTKIQISNCSSTALGLPNLNRIIHPFTLWRSTEKVKPDARLPDRRWTRWKREKKKTSWSCWTYRTPAWQGQGAMRRAAWGSNRCTCSGEERAKKQIKEQGGRNSTAGTRNGVGVGHGHEYMEDAMLATIYGEDTMDEQEIEVFDSLPPALRRKVSLYISSLTSSLSSTSSLSHLLSHLVFIFSSHLIDIAISHLPLHLLRIIQARRLAA